MLERDGHYPPAATLRAELDAIAAAAALPSATLAGAATLPAPPHDPRVARRQPASCAFRYGESCVSGHDFCICARATRSDGRSRRPAGRAGRGPGRRGARPAGFDRDRLAVARRALVRKRAGEVAAVWPLLAASLGSRWHDTVAAHVTGRAPAGALRDGWQLARDLGRCGELSDAAAVELAEREVTLHHDGRRRRLPAARRCGGGAVVQIGGRVHHLMLH